MEYLPQALKKRNIEYNRQVQCFYCEKDLLINDAYLDEDEKIVCGACAVDHQS